MGREILVILVENIIYSPTPKQNTLNIRSHVHLKKLILYFISITGDKLKE